MGIISELGGIFAKVIFRYGSGSGSGSGRCECHLVVVAIVQL